jgi:hypothetical protein
MGLQVTSPDDAADLICDLADAIREMGGSQDSLECCYEGYVTALVRGERPQTFIELQEAWPPQLSDKGEIDAVSATV